MKAFDLVLYIVCGITLLVAMYAVYQTNDIVGTCNEHWKKAFNEMCILPTTFDKPSTEFYNDLNFTLNSSY